MNRARLATVFFSILFGLACTTRPPEMASQGCDPWLSVDELALRDCPLEDSAVSSEAP
jgi:hypothetical protein